MKNAEFEPGKNFPLYSILYVYIRISVFIKVLCFVVIYVWFILCIEKMSLFYN